MKGKGEGGNGAQQSVGRYSASVENPLGSSGSGGLAAGNPSYFLRKSLNNGISNSLVRRPRRSGLPMADTRRLDYSILVLSLHQDSGTLEATRHGLVEAVAFACIIHECFCGSSSSSVATVHHRRKRKSHCILQIDREIERGGKLGGDSDRSNL